MINKRGQKIIITEDVAETKIRQMIDQVFVARDGRLDSVENGTLVQAIQRYLYTYLNEGLTYTEQYAILAAVVELIIRDQDLLEQGA